MLTIDKQQFSQNVRSTLQQIGQIPPLPETARALIKLRNNPDAQLKQLVDTVEKDPGLAAFLIKYARLSGFGYGNRISSVHQAVSLALGYSTALNLSMGIAASGSLRLPNHGALSQANIWGKTLECAAMCRELYLLSGHKRFYSSDIAYLCGLFHNFGHLLFAQLYPQEFSYLNELATHYPEQDARSLQLQIFGITHDTIGMYLVKAWNLPEEIAIAIAEQHFPDYSGKHAVYVKLVALANRLLHGELIIDGCPYMSTGILLNELEIDEPPALVALEKIRQCHQEFQSLAQSLAA